jgi:hypothetical protein
VSRTRQAQHQLSLQNEHQSDVRIPAFCLEVFWHQHRFQLKYRHAIKKVSVYFHGISLKAGTQFQVCFVTILFTYFRNVTTAAMPTTHSKMQKYQLQIRWMSSTPKRRAKCHRLPPRPPLQTKRLADLRFVAFYWSRKHRHRFQSQCSADWSLLEEEA